jgi:1,4-alpha-glucan branching enzyme
VKRQFLESKAGISLVLHAHLPFVRHPEYDWFLEENWFFEAISETYLPLLRMFRNLEKDGIPFRITFCLSPTLGSMLQDDYLADRYTARLEKLLKLAEEEKKRTASIHDEYRLAEMYGNNYALCYEEYTTLYNRDLITPLKKYQEKGNLEIITTAATHAFLPHYMEYPQNMRAQVDTAIDFYRSIFSENPKGFWLPECGYTPDIEAYLESAGINYFVSSAHGILYADEQPRYGLYAPLECPNGMAAFGRDRAASQSVWSAEEGFPGNPIYRDFYRDIGFDLPLDYIGRFVGDGSFAVNTGFKYYSITGKKSLENKHLYYPDLAEEQVRKDSQTYVENRLRQAETLKGLMDRTPLILAPFDAELFGHWWYEGPQFLEEVIRGIHKTNGDLALVTPSDYLSVYPENQKATPAYSSWGEKGYGQVWLDGSNDWIYRHTHKLIERMSELVDRYPNETGLKKRTLDQAAREVLLAQASDWPFIMKTGTTVPYAIKRVKTHINNFNYIYDTLCCNCVKTEWLTRLEKKNKLFPDLDYRIFKKK